MPAGKTGFPGRDIGDAGLRESKDHVSRNKYTRDFFSVPPQCSGQNGYSLPTGALGDLNIMDTSVLGLGGRYYYHVKVGQVILAPVYDLTNGKGLDVAFDATNTRGIEIAFSPNIVTAGGDKGKHGYKIGDAVTGKRFFARLKARITTPSGFTPWAFGFRMVQAYATALATYTDYAVLKIIPSGANGGINIETNLANAGAVTLDTTQTWLPDTVREFRIEVDIDGTVRFLIDSKFPTVTKTNFKFAAASIVIPFMFSLQNATTGTGNFLQEFECGFIPPRAVD